MTRALLAIHSILASSLFLEMSSACGDVTLPHVFGEHMVLQREKPVAVWGTASPGEGVTISIADQEHTTEAGADSKWRVTLEPLNAGGPFTMTVVGTNRIELNDVLVGEVWLCSGQSNMEWPMRATERAEAAIAEADHPRIRLFRVPHRDLDEPANNVDASWRTCRPETVSDFSAVAYYFGRLIRHELDVPVGLIESAWGGTRIEPWIPPVGFASIEEVNDVPQTDTRTNHQRPMCLYNGMIHGLVPYTLRGAIWYQGESNRGDGMMYYHKMRALLAGWRSAWEDEFPFYYVQLAPFRYGGDPLHLPLIWEAQQRALDIPNTGMAVITDITNLGDIHPRNKLDVGERLALWALANTYGMSEFEYSGPLFDSVAFSNAAATVSFAHAASGLKSRDGSELNWFEIAGADKQFVKARARIEGDTVVVWSDDVKSPVAVRFGWHQEAEPNLVNGAGLPASPFRTDDW